MRDIFLFDIPIVILGKIWYNNIGDVNELGRCKKGIRK